MTNKRLDFVTFETGPDDIDGTDINRLLAEHAHAAEKHGYEHLLTNLQMPEIDKLAALMEEVGEVSQLLTYDKRPPNKNTDPRDKAFHAGDGPARCALCQDIRDWRDHLAKELLQVANLALAWHHSVINGGT